MILGYIAAFLVGAIVGCLAIAAGFSVLASIGFAAGVGVLMTIFSITMEDV